MKVITARANSRKLSPCDKDFSYFVSTEGEFGIMVEVNAETAGCSPGVISHLLYFPGDKEAFAFIENFLKTVHRKA